MDNNVEKSDADATGGENSPIIPADEVAAAPLKQITRKEFMKLTLGAYLGLLPGFLALAGLLIVIYLIVVFAWGA